MARVRMVTRTINVTECDCVFMDMVDLLPVIDTVELTGDTYTIETATKAITKSYKDMWAENGHELKFVAVKSINTREDIYGMLETDFLKVAKKLDNERKFIEE